LSHLLKWPKNWINQNPLHLVIIPLQIPKRYLSKKFDGLSIIIFMSNEFFEVNEDMLQMHKREKMN